MKLTLTTRECSSR